jgi:serine protease
MSSPLPRRGTRSVLAVLALLVAVCAMLGAPRAHAADEYNPWAQRLAPTDTDRVIVKLKASDRAAALAAGRVAAPEETVAAIAERTGVAIAGSRNVWGDVHVVRVSGVISVGGLEQAVEKLRADAGVDWAEADARVHAHLTPNDPSVATQWYLQPVTNTANGQTVSAINAISAWDVTQGSASMIVAVLDTGVILNHPDLSPKFVPGWDFVSADSAGTFKIANDGTGWDNDPSDPGDWISATDLTDPVFKDCGSGTNKDQPVNSSWHGTRVSGIIGAATNNAIGIAGTGFNTRLLPVRVLGKCGGFSSDIIAGMRWSAGLTVSGVPTNANPARILNLSLGGQGACTQSYQDAIDEILALPRNVMIVVSAGNDGSSVDRPGNCRGVVSVGAVRHAGTKVGFSNLGPEVTISAPGGNCVNTNGPCLFSIDTTTNTGTTTPSTTNTYTDQNNPNVGTSFSAPIVSGAAALLYAANSNLTATQAVARLKQTARAFPVVGSLPMCRVPVDTNDVQTVECSCTTRTCGAGLLDAGAALAKNGSPNAAIAISGTVTPGGSVQLSGTASSPGAGATLSSYAWSVRPGASGSPSIAPATGQTATLTLPTTGSLSVQLIVTDSAGRTDTATANVMSVVPSLTGQTQAAAATALSNVDLALGGVTLQGTATSNSGVISSQSPASGTVVASGTPVAITLISPTQPITVPSVVGQTQSAATSALTSAGLAVGVVTSEASTTVAAGNVISQTPAAGTSVAGGSTVALVVSSGPPPTTNPGGSSGGGGGGALDAPTLALGLLLSAGALWGRRRRETVRRARN